MKRKLSRRQFTKRSALAAGAVSAATRSSASGHIGLRNACLNKATGQKIQTVSLLGHDGKPEWSQDAEGLTVKMRS